MGMVKITWLSKISGKWVLISRKRYKIETYLQRNANRKSYMANRMAPVLVTLNDREGHSLFASNGRLLNARLSIGGRCWSVSRACVGGDSSLLANTCAWVSSTVVSGHLLCCCWVDRCFSPLTANHCGFHCQLVPKNANFLNPQKTKF